MTPVRRFESGDAVRVVEGAYQGFVGVVIGYDADTDRLVVNIPVFGRQTAIPLHPAGVEPIR